MPSTGAGDVIPGWDAPAGGSVAVTPNDGADLPSGVCRSLYIGGAGNANIDDAQGNTTLFSGLTAGSVLSVRVKRVRATTTTATLIIALY